MNQNPSNMSNEDLENEVKDLQNKDEETPVENANKSEDPEVKEMEKKSMDMGVDYTEDKEQDLDELIHNQADIMHNGSTPDPEELKFREGQ